MINVVIKQHGRPLKTEYSFDEHKCAGSSIITIDAKNICEVNSLNLNLSFSSSYILYESLILAQDERRRCA